MDKPKIIAIVAPTASGKTELAIVLAKQFSGEVISTDSRTVYRGMDIGTAKPGVDSRQHPVASSWPKKIEELFSDKPYMVEGVPHWGFDIADPDEEFTVADFKSYADGKIADILDRGKLPILAGGTGLYTGAVVDNMSFTQAPPDNDLRDELEVLSNDQLVDRLAKADPAAANQIDAANRRRVVRAIEVVETTGKPLADQQTKGEAKYDALILGIEFDRDVLYERIDLRVDQMIAGGLVDEVRALRDKYGCDVNAMTGIGYRQICLFLEGYIKLNDAIDLIKRDTRHFAKRQITWFKRDERINWVEKADDAIELVEEFLK
ncbi:MAG: tRNA (adenosine(37)-N6)-dimethylallyltransferase MiaA [bacterium]